MDFNGSSLKRRNKMNEKLAKTYFGILGIATLISGIVDLIVTFGGGNFSYGILQIPNDEFRGGWGGLIMLFAGFFYLSGIKKISQMRQFAKVVAGSILIWIVAGTDVFGMICSSIPGPEDGPWFNTLGGFLGAYAPPYPPAIFLLPFSFAAIYYVGKYFRTAGK